MGTLYIGERVRKARRQNKARMFFNDAAKREALCLLNKEHERRVRSQSAIAISSWPAEMLTLLPLLKSWRASAYASKLQANFENGRQAGKEKEQKPCEQVL